MSPAVPHQSRQLLHTAVGMAAFQFMNVIAGWWIARSLGPEGQGRFQLVVSWCVFAAMIAKAGLDEGMAYRLPGLQRANPGRVRGLIGYTFLWSLLAGAAAAAMLSFGVGSWLDLERTPHLATDLRWAWLLLPSLLILQLALGALRGLERSDRRALAYYWGVGCGYLSMLAVVTLIDRFDLTSVFVVRAASYLVGIVLAGFWIYRATEKSDGLALGDLKGLHRFSGWLIFAPWFQYLVEQPLIDLMLVGGVAGEAEAGIYSVAARLASLIGLATGSLAIVLGPRYAALLAANAEAQIERTHVAAAGAIAHLATLAGGVLVLAPHAILGLFGEAYTGGAFILRAIALGYVVQAWSGPSAPWLLARGRSRAEGFWTASAAVLMAGGGYLGARMAGSSGVAVATACAVAWLGFGRWLSLRSLADARISRWLLSPAASLVPAALVAGACAVMGLGEGAAIVWSVLYLAFAGRSMIRDLRITLGREEAS